MRTNVLPLKWTPKVVLFTLLLSVIGVSNVYADEAQDTLPYLLYTVYNDYQVCEQKVPVREWNGIDDIRCMQLPKDESALRASGYAYNKTDRTTGFLTLAQNEKEGFHVFYREQEKERNLRIEVTPFINAENEVLQHRMYWEDFYFAPGVGIPDSLAEALVPYAGEIQKTMVGHNKVFFVELKSTMDQTPGEYVSTISIFDGDELITTRTITAKVWNFALPENHYADAVMGLYNCNSGYHATRSIFSLNGLTVDSQGNVAEEDLEEAKRILAGYQECLLEHGVSTYEIPRWLMGDDPKAVELTMADPRRTVFTVPVNRSHFRNGDFTDAAKETINQYKSLVYDNPFLKDKAFFYPMDEPSTSADNIELLNAITEKLAELWPGYHAVTPFYANYSDMSEILDGKVDIFCPNQGAFDPRNSNYDVKQANFLDFIDRENHPNRFKTWRYQGDGKCGGTYFWIYNLSPLGVMRRIPFWQTYYMNSDGWLQWNCAYLPENWEIKTLPASGGIQTGNGDGILVYPGALYGQSPETPVVSLRLKQLSDGLDDHDYLRLGKEFLDTTELKTAMGYFLWGNYRYDCKSINKEYEFYGAYTCANMQRSRYEIGRRLSAANIEHNWGDWQVAVLPDRRHDGLEIRTCSDCGAQSSRALLWGGSGKGDVNGDGFVNVTDATDLINYLLNGEIGNIFTDNADMNDDGFVNITDVTELINKLLSDI